jgi:hypothetical protein
MLVNSLSSIDAVLEILKDDQDSTQKKKSSKK